MENQNAAPEPPEQDRRPKSRWPSRVVRVYIYGTLAGLCLAFGGALFNVDPKPVFLAWSFIFSGIFFTALGLRLWLINNRTKHTIPRWLPNSSFWSLSLFGLLGCLYAYHLQKPHDWLPPELPDDCHEITLLNGSFLLNWEVKDGKVTTPNESFFLDDNDEPMFVPFIKNNRAYLKSRTVLKDKSEIIDIDNEGRKSLPFYWDRNDTTNAFEIMDQNTNPVFQLIYEQPNRIRFSGIIMSKNEILFIGNDGYYMSPFPPTNGFNHPSLKPIFRYPSWKYRHQYAD